MIGEVISDVQPWIQIAASIGFPAAIAWYLISVMVPSINEKFNATVIAMQTRFDAHSDKQSVEFREQLRFVVERHEATVRAITEAQEKQIDRILQQMK
jgi:hypothetical protein